MNVKEKEIEEIFSRGVGEFIDPDGKFKEKLLKKAKGEYSQDIVIKLGADPTRPDLHLGHAVVLRKLRKLQDLGCKVVFVLGDFTTLIGDPSGKSKTRPKIQKNEEEKPTALPANTLSGEPIEPSLPSGINVSETPSSEEIAKNMETYIQQIDKILLTDEKHFSWIKNSDWFLGPTDLSYGPDANPQININNQGNNLSIKIDPNSLVGKAILFEETRMQKAVLKSNKLFTITLRGLMWTLQAVTHGRLIERDMFQQRLNNKEELFMHEMLYPVIQGIDSFAIAQIYGSCDMEVGGTDQTFNILMGRDVMKINKMEPQSVATFKVLEGLDGKEKMSKSLDNYIGLLDTPENMYGKVMSIPDTSIVNYFELCTFTPVERVEEIRHALAGTKTNPKDLKMELAKQIVAEYHGQSLAQKAEEDFVSKFQKNEIPDEVESVIATGTLADTLVAKGIVESKSEWRRLVEQGAVTNLTTNTKIEDPALIASPAVYKIGKHRFIKIVTE